MTTIYLHIGTPKTGSSTIQNFLFLNKEKLRNKDFLYCLSEKITEFKNPAIHHNLILNIIPNLKKVYGYRKQVSWEYLLEELELLKPEKAIISSETFYLYLINEVEKIQTLKSKLSKYNIKIIIYIRKQSEFIYSYYKQVSKIYYKKIFDYFLLDEYALLDGQKNVPFIKIADYYANIKEWEEVFGKENIIVRVFSKKEFRGGNLLEDFLSVIGYPIEDSDLESIRNTAIRNISPNPKNIRLTQFLNSYFPQMKSYYLPILLGENKVTNLIANLPDFLISGDEFMSSEKKAEIDKMFVESNRKLLQEYLHKEDGNLF